MQFSRGMEIREQYYYYDRIALLILFNNRIWVNVRQALQTLEVL